MVPKQKHPSRGKGGTQAKTDKSKAHKAAKGSKGPAATKKSVATRPEGTAIAGAGGRKSRANTYG